MSVREVRILPDVSAIAKRAAEQFVQIAAAAVADHGRFTVALAGGSTPKPLYLSLVEDPSLRERLPWDKMGVFFGDERHVGPGHPDSNFQMASDAFLSKAPLKPEQVKRIKGEYEDTDKAAREYEKEIRDYFQLRDSEFPRFDLIFLGMGNDGHTLSLFPGTKALHESHRIVTRNWVGKFYTERITLTAPTANNADAVMFMIAGADKAPALKAVLEGPVEPDQLPSQMIRPVSGKLFWLVDRAAGAMLTTGIRE
ncbi:MAG TPA: 6-phosphogluconolactonase [Terriglobales bacterium]|nr:6-phosphogluconolactonase [Terriglobales bacterium]